MLFTVLLLSLLLAQTPCTETKALPRGLIALLEKMRVPLENYPNSTMNDPDFPISAQFDESTRLQDSSDVPEYSGGVITNQINIPVHLSGADQANCDPRLTAVKLPTTPGYLNYPSYVLLHRCTGGCLYAEDSMHCTVSQRDELIFGFYKISDRGAFFTNVKMFDHKDCDCDCIKKASDCDPVKHVWHADICACTCKSHGSLCDQTQRWSEANCECQCRESLHCTNNKEWDLINCGCHCKRNLQEKCQSQNLNINPETCECVEFDIDAF